MSLDHGVLGGILKSTKIEKSTRYMLPKSRGMFSGKKNACGKHIEHGVLGGILKSTKIDKIHAPNLQGVFFSEVSEAPQAAATKRTGLGDLKPITNACAESAFLTFPKR